MISDDQLEEVKARADIVDIIGEDVQLKKSGSSYMGKCPFHEDSTPSFSVKPGAGYHCFGCGAKGDVFTYLEERRGLDFMEAVRFIAARTGVQLREVEREEEDPEVLFQRGVNAFAQDWFIERLTDATEGRRAREYLDRRGIDAETREAFGIGWAPDEWRAFRDAAAGHGIGDDDLLRMGLVKHSSKNPSGEPYDMFRGRVMFPIRDLRGRPIAFGGRILGDGRPKYVNSSETPVYTKGEHLYGFDRARRKMREDGAMLVEGYMDLVSLAAAGFDNVVASLGTALTPEQAGLIKRFGKADRVLILYDSDAAGLKATFRAADILLAAGLEPMAVTLPPGEDPDTLVQKQGREALERHLADALDIVDLKLKILADRGRLSTSAGKRDSLDRLLPTLRATTDDLLRSIYVGQVADRLGMRAETIEAELAKAPREPRGLPSTPPPPPRGAPVERGPAKQANPRWARSGPGWTILRILARDRERRHEHLNSILESIGPEDFKNDAERSIFQTFVDDPDLTGPRDGLDARAVALLDELLAEVSDPDELASAGRMLHDSVSRLVEDRLHHEMDRLQRAIEDTDDVDEKRRLLLEKARLREEASAIGIRWAPALKKHARGFNEQSR